MKNLVAAMLASMALFACTPRDVLDMPVPDVENPAEVDKVRKLMFARVGVPEGSSAYVQDVASFDMWVGMARKGRADCGVPIRTVRDAVGAYRSKECSEKRAQSAIRERQAMDRQIDTFLADESAEFERSARLSEERDAANVRAAEEIGAETTRAREEALARRDAEDRAEIARQEAELERKVAESQEQSKNY